MHTSTSQKHPCIDTVNTVLNTSSPGAVSRFYPGQNVREVVPVVCVVLQIRLESPDLADSE